MSDNQQNSQQQSNNNQQPDTFPREYVEELRQENKERRIREQQMQEQLNSILERLGSSNNEQADEEQDPATAIETRFTTLENELKSEREARVKAEQNVLRSAIASEYNLPAGMAGRLQGSTEEELRQDAEQLATLFPEQSEQQQKRTTTGIPGGETPTGMTREQALARLKSVGGRRKDGPRRNSIRINK